MKNNFVKNQFLNQYRRKEIESKELQEKAKICYKLADYEKNEGQRDFLIQAAKVERYLAEQVVGFEQEYHKKEGERLLMEARRINLELGYPEDEGISEDSPR